jgi:hypothetical protein
MTQEGVAYRGLMKDACHICYSMYLFIGKLYMHLVSFELKLVGCVLLVRLALFFLNLVLNIDSFHYN